MRAITCNLYQNLGTTTPGALCAMASGVIEELADISQDVDGSNGGLTKVTPGEVNVRVLDVDGSIWDFIQNELEISTGLLPPWLEVYVGGERKFLGLVDPSRLVRSTSADETSVEIGASDWSTSLSSVYLGAPTGSPWLPSHDYEVGTQVVSGGSSYVCTHAGTSAASGGPQGIGGNIWDGTVVWAYVAPGWKRAIPPAAAFNGSTPDPVLGYSWINPYLSMGQRATTIYVTNPCPGILPGAVLTSTKPVFAYRPAGKPSFGDGEGGDRMRTPGTTYTDGDGQVWIYQQTGTAHGDPVYDWVCTTPWTQPDQSPAMALPSADFPPGMVVTSPTGFWQVMPNGLTWTPQVSWAYASPFFSVVSTQEASGLYPGTTEAILSSAPWPTTKAPGYWTAFWSLVGVTLEDVTYWTVAVTVPENPSPECYQIVLEGSVDGIRVGDKLQQIGTDTSSSWTVSGVDPTLCAVNTVESVSDLPAGSHLFWTDESRDELVDEDPRKILTCATHPFTIDLTGFSAPATTIPVFGFIPSPAAVGDIWPTASGLRVSQGGKWGVNQVSCRNWGGTLDGGWINLASTQSFTGAMLASGNGVTTTFRLPVDTNVAVTGLSRTDWQGTRTLFTSQRKNQLKYSQDGSQGAVWTKRACSYTPNAAVAPDGTLTAGLLVSDTATDYRYISQISSASAVTGQPVTLSTWVKAGTCPYVYLLLGNAAFGSPGFSTAPRVSFNLATGVVNQSLGGATGTITPAGDGWFRLTITAVPTATGAVGTACYLSNAAWAGSWAGDGTSSIYWWGADLRFNANGTHSYIPSLDTTGTATDYALAGNVVTLAQTYNPVALNTFWTADGAATSKTVPTPNGNPTSASFWRTDWQGRQLLYSTSRTNLCPRSVPAVGAVGYSFAGVAGTNATGPDGTTSAMSFSPGASISDVFAPLTASAQGVGSYVVSCYVLPSEVDSVELLQAVNSAYASVAGSVTPVLTPGVWQLIRFAFTNPSSQTLRPHLRVKTGKTCVVGEFQLEAGSLATSRIRTSGAAVTVTDYTLVGATFTPAGGAPPTGTTFQWSGTYLGGLALGSTLSWSGSGSLSQVYAPDADWTSQLESAPTFLMPYSPANVFQRLRNRAYSDTTYRQENNGMILLNGTAINGLYVKTVSSGVYEYVEGGVSYKTTTGANFTPWSPSWAGLAGVLTVYDYRSMRQLNINGASIQVVTWTSPVTSSVTGTHSWPGSRLIQSLVPMIGQAGAYLAYTVDGAGATPKLEVWGLSGGLLAPAIAVPPALLGGNLVCTPYAVYLVGASTIAQVKLVGGVLSLTPQYFVDTVSCFFANTLVARTADDFVIFGRYDSGVENQRKTETVLLRIATNLTPTLSGSVFLSEKVADGCPTVIGAVRDPSKPGRIVGHYGGSLFQIDTSVPMALGRFVPGGMDAMGLIEHVCQLFGALAIPDANGVMKIVSRQNNTGVISLDVPQVSIKETRNWDEFSSLIRVSSGDLYYDAQGADGGKLLEISEHPLVSTLSGCAALAEAFAAWVGKIRPRSEEEWTVTDLDVPGAWEAIPMFSRISVNGGDPCWLMSRSINYVTGTTTVKTLGGA